MKNRSQQACPSIDELSQLLEPHTTLDRGLDQHLDECAQCRETLCFLAGDATWWEEASAVLSAPQPVRRLAPAICALSTGESPRRGQDPLCEHELQQLQLMLQPASHPELIGRVGRYELEQLVGRGGMGLVFRARDMELHRVVAVKTLAIHLVPIGAARDRFVREARATASLTHPHIVPVFDVITEGVVPAIVMQFIAGPTLEHKLSEQGPLAWQDVLQIGIQLADALAVAHERGLVHRDIKPGNVLLEADGSRALLTDFGLARVLDDATLTRSGVLAGTPDYMSPEQASGQTVGHSSDLFSLGSLLYAMLSGHPPFRAASPLAIMHRICHQRQRPVAEVRADVPLEVSRTLDRLLAKVPKKRFASAADVAEHLRALASSTPRLRLARRRARRLRFLAGLTTVAAVVAGLWFQPFSGSGWPTSLSQPTPQLGLQHDLGAVAANRERAETSSRDSDGAAADLAGFAELRILDQRLQALSRDAQQLSTAQPRLSPEQILNTTPPLQNVDLQVDALRLDLERLEQELQE